MTFLHWAYDPAVVPRLVPPELEVETYEGRAWVSMTPFVMTDFRLSGLPPVPGLSTFPETNLRTYVRGPSGPLSGVAGPSGRDGLWFLSLEADSLPTVVAASTLYGVPYRWADMTVDRGPVTRYRSHRRLGSPVGHDVTIRAGAPCIRG